MCERECTLISAKTGEKHLFRNVSAACRFLGRNPGYIGNCINMRVRITDKETGELYTVSLGERIERKKTAKPQQRKSGWSGIEFFPEQLCTHCKNFAFGCEWSESLKPVPGWDAFPTRGGESYCITGCPKFAEG